MASAGELASLDRLNMILKCVDYTDSGIQISSILYEICFKWHFYSQSDQMCCSCFYIGVKMQDLSKYKMVNFVGSMDICTVMFIVACSWNR